MIEMIGYVRVSTGEQADSGLGLEAQEAVIRAEVERKGWQLSGIVRDEGKSGKSLDRPGLAAALTQIRDGEAGGLVVAKLDRLSRSLVDFGRLLEWFKRADATLVVLDLGVDTSTPSGALVANVMASVAEWEREAAAARTREALRAKRNRGEAISRPAVADRPELLERVCQLREAGATYQAIADTLNREKVPTLRGGVEWRPSSVQAATGYRRPGFGSTGELPKLRRRRRG